MKCALAILGVWLCLSQAQGMMGEEDGRPAEHLCPITMEVMRDPVVASDGNTYERAAIEEWLGRRNTSPLTNRPLAPRLVENLALKKMISEWRAGGAAQPSAFAGRSAQSIVSTLRTEFDRNAALLGPGHGADERDIVAVLGNTGAGKSTLVNLLAGKALTVNDDGEDYVLVNPNDPESMAIGGSGSSETLYPKSIDVGSLRIFDLPGFNDTDGSERNLVNAALIRQILTSANSVRLLVVAGQDQFTADRSASIKQMMQAISNLFVVEDRKRSLLDEAIFVATKVTANDLRDTEFLLRKTHARDKEALSQQLRTWHASGRLLSMVHPLRDREGAGLVALKASLLDLMQHRTRPVKIRSLNVSALYPPETAADLRRVFANVMDDAFAHYTQTPLTTVSDYDHQITACEGEDFWGVFESQLCERDDATRLLREFCAGPYQQARQAFEAEHQAPRESYLEALRECRLARTRDIQERTGERFDAVVAALPRAADAEMLFDFAYHKDFYDQVCGAESILQLATDAAEQEVVRGVCVDLINAHANAQMDRAMNPLMQQMRALEARVRALEPLPAAAAAASSAASSSSAVVPVPRPLGDGIEIPDIARGYEEVYRRFLGGTLVYRPNGDGNDTGMITLKVSDLVNPLEGTFDLSRCGDTGKYLSISTEYRKGKISANANKVEIWFTPWFVADAVKAHLPQNHYLRSVTTPDKWDPVRAPVGIFWTWGGWDDLQYADYLTTQNMEEIGSVNLYVKWHHARSVGWKHPGGPPDPSRYAIGRFVWKLKSDR